MLGIIHSKTPPYLYSCISLSQKNIISIICIFPLLVKKNSKKSCRFLRRQLSMVYMSLLFDKFFTFDIGGMQIVMCFAFSEAFGIPFGIQSLDEG